MYSEYNDILMCYGNATTMAQLQRCDNKANAFTQKYGGMSMLTVSLTPQEKKAVSYELNKLEKQVVKFRQNYYKAKPQVQRNIQDAVKQAEDALNNLNVGFDNLREFLGVKSFATKPLPMSLQSIDYEQMMNEYYDLLNCYSEATTLGQIQTCDRQAQDFTVKYGGSSSNAVALQSIDFNQMMTEY